MLKCMCLIPPFFFLIRFFTKKSNHRFHHLIVYLASYIMLEACVRVLCLPIVTARVNLKDLCV